MENIIIGELQHQDKQEIADMLAEAFKNNPNSKAVWTDSSSEKALSAFAKIVRIAKLDRKFSHVYVAKFNGKAVGAINFSHWPNCQPAPLEKIVMLPRLISTFGSALPKAVKIMTTWGKHDPQKAHCHIGPLGVLSQFHGNGIGSQLLKHCLNIADEAKIPCYLETDALINVSLYERHGFKVINEVPIHGYKTWLMWRDTSKA